MKMRVRFDLCVEDQAIPSTLLQSQFYCTIYMKQPYLYIHYC